VQADPRQLELALLNLAVNARDAMPHGGTITIAAGCEKLATTVDGLPSGNYVRLSVIDEGEGMDESILAKATEPFFTTKGIGKGTGLGLPMVQGLAHQSGGRFVLRSVKGTGTTAEIWLRLFSDEAGDRPVSAAMVELEPDRVSIAPLLVLAVDDDPLVLENTATMLTELGHKVLKAHSGSEALQVLVQHSVDLIITDYAMPGMTGEELTQRLLADRPELPVLMVSGYASLPKGTGISVPKLGKPFKERELSRAIADVIALKRVG
jgi:CheY-like chemotaxis protein